MLFCPIHSGSETALLHVNFHETAPTTAHQHPQNTPSTNAPFRSISSPPKCVSEGEVRRPARRQRAGAGALSGEGALFGRSIACNLGVTRSTNVSEAGPLLGGFFFWVLDLVEHIAFTCRILNAVGGIAVLALRAFTCLGCSKSIFNHYARR